MPPKKFTDLTADTTPAAADIMAVSQSPFGAGSSKKVTLANLWFQIQKWLFAIDSVGTDSYAITLSPAITAYTDGQLYRFKAGTANTGAATLNINGLGAKTIKKMAGGLSDLSTNDIRVGQMVDVVYDLSNDCFQMQSAVGNLAGGAAVNPTSLFIPYNNAGVFADSPFKRQGANEIRQQNGSNIQKVLVCADDGGTELSGAVVTNQSVGTAEFAAERASSSTSVARLIARNSGNTTGGQGVEISNGGPFRPSQGSTDLGASTGNNWNNIFANSEVFCGSGVRVGSLTGASTSGYLYQAFGIPSVRVRNGSDNAYMPIFDFGRSANVAQFDKTNTTLADITSLTTGTNLAAGQTYKFEAVLFFSADATGGHKYAIGGTATATDIRYHIQSICNASSAMVITSTQTAIGGSAGQAGCVAGVTIIRGTIKVNAAGTLTVQFAQNAASGTSSILTMSSFHVEQMRYE